jgi:hypothetical protein
MIPLTDQIQFIAKCIATSLNAQHLDVCAKMIEERIESWGAYSDAEKLRKLILVRQCELLITQYQVYE